MSLEVVVCILEPASSLASLLIEFLELVYIFKRPVSKVSLFIQIGEFVINRPMLTVHTLAVSLHKLISQLWS